VLKELCLNTEVENVYGLK